MHYWFSPYFIWTTYKYYHKKTYYDEAFISTALIFNADRDFYQVYLSDYSKFSEYFKLWKSCYDTVNLSGNYQGDIETFSNARDNINAAFEFIFETIKNTLVREVIERNKNKVLDVITSLSAIAEENASITQQTVAKTQEVLA